MGHQSQKPYRGRGFRIKVESSLVTHRKPFATQSNQLRLC